MTQKTPASEIKSAASGFFGAFRKTGSDFKEFILRGNVIDLAVGVMIGGAFNTVVSSLVKDIMTPLVAALVKQPNFSTLTFTLHGSQFSYGDFLNNLISFLITAATIFFFIVQPINRIHDRMHRGDEKPSPTTKQCPECLSTIPIAAKRCAFCTSKLPVDEPKAAQKA